MSLQKAKEILGALDTDGVDNTTTITLPLKDLRDLILAAETLKMIAYDMVTLKETLNPEDGSKMRRATDVLVSTELSEMVGISMVSLKALESTDLDSADVGDFVCNYIQRTLYNPEVFH
jgi:hypothetical protein